MTSQFLSSGPTPPANLTRFLFSMTSYAQDMVGLRGCEQTLLAHVLLFIHQYPQVLLHRAALNPFISQPVLIPGVALTQVQDTALGLVEPHEVHTGPLLQIVQVPLDGISSLRRVSYTAQLGVVCKLAEGALDPAVNVIDEDIKQYWSQYRPLRDTTRSSGNHKPDLLLQWEGLCSLSPLLQSIHLRVQLQPRLGLPDPIPTQTGSIPIVFPGYLSLLPLPFDQQVSTQPCQSLAFLAWFLTPGDRELLRSVESVLKDLPALFCSLVPEGSFPGGPID
ncbi:hypothetical protein QYF61_017918 [Mycteria americana]|uniref:Uncharacterized protein n=1 Tax=Mycteria americana TaxID=33587 RepID=A0AAN7N2K1_MYCAM|nr:hypothetical protein QYF61_017918 [Mycteria americana]